MIIWSIDVGHRNMGLAILEVPDVNYNPKSKPAGKKEGVTPCVAWESVVIKKLETLSAWSDKKVANVNKRPLHEICCQVYKLLHFLMHEKFPDLHPGLVLIEQQPTRGVKNRVLQFFIHGFFLGKGIPNVRQVSSKLKMSELVLKPPHSRLASHNAPSPKTPRASIIVSGSKQPSKAHCVGTRF